MGHASARTSARVARLLIPLVVVLFSSTAGAESKIEFFARKLRDPDFKVRVNAALALGALDDDAAVSPLCGSIGDDNDLVRKAIAKGLERLKRPSGAGCLKQRIAVESDGGVKLQMQRALDAIQSGGGGGGGVVPNAKFYVSISPVNNQTSRPQGDVDNVIQGAIKAKLGQMGGYQIAPTGESVDGAKAAMNGRSLKGYYLAVSLEKFDYSDGGLRVRIKVAVFSYPGKDLKGELGKGASISGARPGDKSTEDQLMNAVAGAAAEAFTQNFK